MQNVPQKSLESMISTFFYYSTYHSKKINKILYPNSKVYTLRFPHAFRGINHKSANRYLFKTSKGMDGVALFGLPEDIGYIISMLRKYRPNALKMYYLYPEQTAKTIYETFSEEILKEVNELHIPCIIHLPKVITESKNDLLAVSKKYQELKICIPHLGSTKFVVPNLEKTYKELAKKTNIYLDTSLNPSCDVARLALKYFGPERIMFGSDQPLNLLRAKPYINPTKGQRLITGYIYHWVDIEEHRKYKHLATDLVHSHWAPLLALKEVIEEYPIDKQEQIKKMIFYDNAKKFYNFE